MDSEGGIFDHHIFFSKRLLKNRDTLKMEEVQSTHAVSNTSEIGMDCTTGSSNVSETAKTIENYSSPMQPNIGFVKSTAAGMVLPQFPCLVVNYQNRPGPLITPNLVPVRPVAHAFDIQNETPNSNQRLDSNGRNCDSDTMCMLPFL